MMHITEIDIPKDEDERESFLASYAVYLANQKARALGLPRYYSNFAVAKSLSYS